MSGLRISVSLGCISFILLYSDDESPEMYTHHNNNKKKKWNLFIIYIVRCPILKYSNWFRSKEKNILGVFFYAFFCLRVFGGDFNISWLIGFVFLPSLIRIVTNGLINNLSNENLCRSYLHLAFFLVQHDSIQWNISKRPKYKLNRFFILDYIRHHIYVMRRQLPLVSDLRACNSLLR